MGGAFVGTTGILFAVVGNHPAGGFGGLLIFGGDRERYSVADGGQLGGGAFAGAEPPLGTPLPFAVTESPPRCSWAVSALGRGPLHAAAADGWPAAGWPTRSSAAIVARRGTFGVMWWNIGTAAVFEFNARS